MTGCKRFPSTALWIIYVTDVFEEGWCMVDMKRNACVTMLYFSKLGKNDVCMFVYTNDEVHIA